MTYKELERLRRKLEAQRHQTHASNPFLIGYGRALFEKAKLEILIAAGNVVEGRTAKSQVAKWKKTKGRVEQSISRFSSMVGKERSGERPRETV